MSIRSFPLEIPFEGDRKYLHGPKTITTLSAVLYRFFDGGYLKGIIFRGFCRNKCVLVVGEKNDGKDVFASGQWICDDGTCFSFYVLETSTKVEQRVAFDESLITKTVVVDGYALEGTGSEAFHPLANIVIMIKLLSYSITPNPKGRWVFVQGNFNFACPESVNHYKINQLSRLGSRFNRNEIWFDDRRFGEIKFAAAEL